MTIPSFTQNAINDQRSSSQIQILEVRDPKNITSAPVAWLALERVVKFTLNPSTGEIANASLHLHYHRILPEFSLLSAGGDRFIGSYCAATNSVSVTSDGGTGGTVFLSLPGLEGFKIGTYLLNQIVTWVKQWPDARLSNISLNEIQATDENRERRNRFYEQFGIKFSYDDDKTRKSGRSLSMVANDLTPVDREKSSNITEIQVDKFISGLFSGKEKSDRLIAEKSRSIELLQNELFSIKQQPLKWALKRLADQLIPPVTLALIFAAVVGMIWLRFR